MKNTQKEVNELSYHIIGCAIEVHRHLGPGLLESIYEKCFLKELQIRDLSYKNQEWLAIVYKGEQFKARFKDWCTGWRHHSCGIKKRGEHCLQHTKLNY